MILHTSNDTTLMLLNMRTAGASLKRMRASGLTCLRLKTQGWKFGWRSLLRWDLYYLVYFLPHMLQHPMNSSRSCYLHVICVRVCVEEFEFLVPTLFIPVKDKGPVSALYRYQIVSHYLIFLSSKAFAFARVKTYLTFLIGIAFWVFVFLVLSQTFIIQI